MTVNCLEEKRSSISIEEVKRYIKDIEQILHDPPKSREKIKMRFFNKIDTDHLVINFIEFYGKLIDLLSNIFFWIIYLEIKYY